MKSTRRLFFATFLLVFGLLPGSLLPLRGEGAVETMTARGLHTVRFDTLHGQVVVNFPDDMAAGDTISGSVIAEPKGDTEESLLQNRAEMSGYSVEVEDAGAARGDDRLTWTVPAGLAGQEVSILLRDSLGREVGSAVVPVAGAPAPIGSPQPPDPSDFILPGIAQAGRPVSIRGAFDGDFSTTDVEIGGHRARLLAESPRKAVVESPSEAVGPSAIELKEKDLIARGTVNNLRVALAFKMGGKSSAPRIPKGQNGTLEVRVEGLQGLPPEAFPIPVETVNLTPGVVRLEGAAWGVFHHDIPSGGPNPGGTYTYTVPVQGIREGDFSINTFIQQGECRCDCEVNILDSISQEGAHRYREVQVSGEGSDPNTYTFRARAKLIECQGGGRKDVTGKTTYKWSYQGPKNSNINPEKGSKTTLTYDRKEKRGGGKLGVTATVPYKCGREKRTAQCGDSIAIEETRIEGEECICKLFEVRIADGGLNAAEVRQFEGFQSQVKKYVVNPRYKCPKCNSKLEYRWTVNVTGGAQVGGGGREDDHVLLQANRTPMTYSLQVEVTLKCGKESPAPPACQNTRGAKRAGKVQIDGLPRAERIGGGN